MSETEAQASAGWSALWREGYLVPVLLTCFGIWLHAADSLLVATLIPSIIGDIGGAQFIAWTVALYEIGSIIAGAASALIALRYGLRRAMSAAALLYCAGCVASALAPEMTIMLLGRLAQGLGGGALVALALLSVGRLFPPRLMPRAMAAISLCWGLSAFTGPLIGGFFAGPTLWRGGFAFFAVQALALALWINVALRGAGKPDSGSADGGFPARRLLTLSLGVILIAAAGIEVTPIRSTLLVAAGTLAVIAFLRMDAARGDNRLLPPRAFSLADRSGAGLLMIFAMSAASIPFAIFGPVLMTILHDTPAIVAGYILAIESIGWSVMAVITAGIAERHDRTLVRTGMSIVALSIPAFYIVVPTGPLWLIAIVAFLAGAGFGTAWTFILRRFTAITTGKELDRTAAAMPTVQRFGYAIGAALTGIVANASGFAGTGSVETAATTAHWIFAAMLPLATLGLIATWCFVREVE